MNIIFIILGMVVVQKALEFILKFLDLALGHKRLRLDNELLKAQLEDAKSTINLYRTSYQNLLSVQKRDISKDEIDAVKYAMKHSHPDNGGDAADFMRFQKVYKELTRK